MTESRTQRDRPMRAGYDPAIRREEVNYGGWRNRRRFPREPQSYRRHLRATQRPQKLRQFDGGEAGWRERIRRRVTGACVTLLEEPAVTVLFEALGTWLGW